MALHIKDMRNLFFLIFSLFSTVASAVNYNCNIEDLSNNSLSPYNLELVEAGYPSVRSGIYKLTNSSSKSIFIRGNYLGDAPKVDESRGKKLYEIAPNEAIIWRLSLKLPEQGWFSTKEETIHSNHKWIDIEVKAGSSIELIGPLPIADSNLAYRLEYALISIDKGIFFVISKPYCNI